MKHQSERSVMSENNFSKITHVIDRKGNLHVAAVSKDKAIWYFIKPADGGKWIFQRLGGKIRSQITLLLNHEGNIQIFGAGIDGSIYSIKQNKNSREWGGWFK